MKNTYKVGMISLGCPKNQVDGELLLEKLSENGFQIVQRIEDSDLMIVNTCGFIEDAKREAIETILEVAQYKAAGVISAIVVTGCPLPGPGDGGDSGGGRRHWYRCQCRYC